MRISELFYSIQGEGLFAGLPMAFVRFQGCPFRCSWCDSQYTWDFKGGQEMELSEVLARLAAWPARRVCITGGEPLAHLPDFRMLTAALKEQGYWVEVETSGGYRIPWDTPVDSWVMDIKCPGSGMAQYNKYEELASLRPQDQVKFVVADRPDFDFAVDILRRHPTRAHVLFSPVWGRVSPADLAAWTKDEAPEARLSLQLHKIVWEPTARGV